MRLATLFCLGTFLATFSVRSAVSSGAGSTRTSLSVINARQNVVIEGRVFLDLNNRAEASGTVYRWTYCYSADGDPPPYELVIAMYRPQHNGSYQLVPGSYRQLRITTPLGNSFDCRDIDLQTSEYFSVQTNDVVAVCEPIGVRRVEVFFSDPAASLSGWNAGSCSMDSISFSGSLSNTETTFLLRASINVDECAEGNHDCHENAKCTDVVGGFTCDCITGFTGNGSVCEAQIYCLAAGVSSVAICVITIVVGLVCVKVRQTKKTDTSKRQPTSGPKKDSDSPAAPGENDINSRPCLAYGVLDTEQKGQNELYYSYASM